MAHPLYTYNPPPQEQAYYDALFTAADKTSSGYLSGPTAVEFLSLSKLPVDLLKTIWSMADQNPTNNTLDKPKFTVAVRLIQLFQNGKKPVDLELNLSPEDAANPMRPPFFEGVNPAAAPPQQQQQQAPPPQYSPQPSPPMQPMSSPMRPTATISMNGGMGGMSTPSTIGTAMSTNNMSTALATQDPYTMTPAEQTRYSALFPTYATVEPNYVHGPQAVELFLKSGMDRDQLKLIWTMCDDDPVDNKLDVVEFAIAMHLIVCVTKKGLGLPQVLPASLVRVRRESRMQQQSQEQAQQQGIPTPTQNNMGGASVVGGGMSTVGGMSTMQQQQDGGGGGIPSPEKMPGMNGHVQQQQQGGASQMGMQQQGGGMTMMPSPEQQQPQMVQQQPQMVQPPPLMAQQQQPQMSMQQPQMGMQQPGMMQQQQRQPEQQQMGMANGHTGGFGSGFGSSGAIGGETVDDAFAGLPNDPIPDVDAYSAIGGPAAAATTTTVEQQPAIPAPPLINSTAAIPAASPVLQSMAPPSAFPTMAPVQAPQPVPPPPAAVSMPSPKSPKRNVAISGNANAELEELKAAHQKLQAEAVSLRAKAGLVSDEEQDAQAEIAKVASEIAALSTELEGLRTQVMEAKVKLSDAVSTLKAQKEKKESLETAVEESKETVEALNAATEALVEANETAMAHQAKALANAAAAKEKAEEEAAAAPSADLFSWDAAAPAAASTPAASPQMQGMGAPWGEMPGQPVPSEPDVAPVADAGSVYSMGGASGFPQQPASVADASSVYSTNSVHREQSGFSSTNGVQHSSSFYSASDNQRDASFGSVQQPMAPPAPQYGMGIEAAPQPMMQQQQAMMAPSVNTAAQPVQQKLPTIESPTSEELDQIKKDAALAEKSFRASEDLVRTLAKEVKHLENAAVKAEEEKKAIESKKKKMGGKKKHKKEIEKAYEFAMGEQQKVQQARQQLDAARRQSDIAKNEVDKLRQKYEEAEVEAATAASYLSANAYQSMGAGSVGPTGSVAPQQQYQQYQQQQQYQQPAPANDMFSSDPFGMGGGGMGQQAASDPYGMGLMGGSADGDYSNPFAM